jgi:hypothetical protein
MNAFSARLAGALGESIAPCIKLTPLWLERCAMLSAGKRGAEIHRIVTFLFSIVHFAGGFR